MKEKHRKIPILVLAVTTVLLFGFFMLTASQAFADQGHKGNGQQQKEWQHQQPQKERQQQQQQHNNPPPAHRDYNNQHANYDRYPGYRPHPYNRGLHYGQYKYKGHQYDYHGHWRSWDQWHRYASENPDIERHGTYYRENSHLMFRYCDPGSGACFFFSIGG